MHELVCGIGVFLTNKELLNCCVESNTEVEDEYQKKFELWAEQERSLCNFCCLHLIFNSEYFDAVGWITGRTSAMHESFYSLTWSLSRKMTWLKNNNNKDSVFGAVIVRVC